MEQLSFTPTKCPAWSRAILAIFCLCIPILAFLMWTQRQLPAPVSEHGPGIDSMINFTLLTSGILLVVGHGVLAWFIWRFGGQSRVTFRQASGKTEWKLALIPIVTMALVAEGGVLLIGIPVWNKFYAAKPPEDALRVEVTAEQFAWTMRYPGTDGTFGRTRSGLIDDENLLGLDSEDSAGKDDVVVRGELCVPTGKPVRLFLRSKDVLHSFYLPYHRVKQDTVPGMVIHIWFVPTEPGTYEILCAELCGLGHYKMRGLFKVVSEDEFKRWLEEQKAAS